MNQQTGLSVIRKWLSPEETAQLCHMIRIPRLMSSRRTLRYGSFQPYQHGVRQRTIPSEWHTLSTRLHQEGHLGCVATNVAINMYARGQGITPHTDAISCGPEIAVVNLQGVGQLNWYGPEKQQETTTLQPGDLLVMSGTRRYDWLHEVPPWNESNPRVSVVFRYAAGTNS
jgi:alkylated DNA repair dioxygenase AlkB